MLDKIEPMDVNQQEAQKLVQQYQVKEKLFEEKNIKDKNVAKVFNCNICEKFPELQ